MPGDADLCNRLSAIRTVDLTTRGRRSGRAARIEIWWFRVDGRFVITGTPGPRDWYANVLADETVIIHTPIGDHLGRATPITDPEVRRSVLSDPDLSWYRSQAELEELVESAPMVEITLDDLA